MKRIALVLASFGTISGFGLYMELTSHKDPPEPARVDEANREVP